MGLRVMHVLACDRCGATKSAEVDEPRAYGNVRYAVGQANKGSADGAWWHATDKGRCLCPACAEAYHEIRGRYARELDEFFSAG